MSATSKRLVTAALHGLDVIGELAEKYGGDKGQKASAALAAIGAIVESIQDGWAREINPAEVHKQIERALAQLEADIAANDKAADAAVDAKFPSAPRATPPKADVDPPRS